MQRLHKYEEMTFVWSFARTANRLRRADPRDHIVKPSKHNGPVFSLRRLSTCPRLDLYSSPMYRGRVVHAQLLAHSVIELGKFPGDQTFGARVRPAAQLLIQTNMQTPSPVSPCLGVLETARSRGVCDTPTRISIFVMKSISCAMKKRAEGGTDASHLFDTFSKTLQRIALATHLHT
jgi:hypothetical protein